MEGNFLSRYNNKIEEWTELIKNDPTNKSNYEREMSDYMIKCMPFIERHMTGETETTHTDNVFNLKETVGLARKDIFTDYLVEVGNKNIARPVERTVEMCSHCEYSNIILVQSTSDLICDGCGRVVAAHINEELTYREEQENIETSEATERQERASDIQTGRNIDFTA